MLGVSVTQPSPRPKFAFFYGYDIVKAMNHHTFVKRILIALLIVNAGGALYFSFRGASPRGSVSGLGSALDAAGNLQQPGAGAAHGGRTVGIEILRIGRGASAMRGDIVVVEYTGRLEDGTVFDSSTKHGGPFTFTLSSGEVIRGWDEGLAGMKPGEKRKLTVPPEFGYGARGIPGSVPPDATLVFEVTLLRVEPPAPF